MLEGIEVLLPEGHLQKAFVQNVVEYFLRVGVLQEGLWGRLSELGVQVFNVKFAAVVPSEFVLRQGPRVEDGIKNGLVALVLWIFLALLNLQLNILLDRKDLLFSVELVDAFRKVLNVVLVIHLCELFKDDELVDTRVDLLAPLPL